MRPITMEAMTKLPYALEVAVHPEGLGAAVILQEADLEVSAYYHHIWWTAPGRAPRRLTRGRHNQRAVQISPDGGLITFLSNRLGAPQLFALPLAGGEPYPLTGAERGVLTYAWAPDGSRLFFTTPTADTPSQRWQRAEQQRRKLDGYIHLGDRRPRQVWTVQPDGTDRRQLWAGDPGVEEIAPSPDGRWLAFSTNRTGLVEDDHCFDLGLLNTETGAVRPLTGRRGSERAPAWNPSSTQIAFQANQDPEHVISQFDLFVTDLSGSEPRDLTAHLKGDTEWFAWQDDSTMLVALGQGPVTNLYWMDGANLQHLTTARAFSLSPDRQWLACLAQDPQSLPEIELLNLTTGARERLTRFSEALNAYHIPTAEVVWWEGARGDQVEGILTQPSGPGPHPLIVLIHGGPHYRSQLGILIGQSMRARVLASHGYAVLQPNFHGSTGYGNAFAMALYRSTGEIDSEDVLTGVEALVARGVADPERLGVMGGSYGGFLTNWVIGRTDRFKAAVSQFGMWSLTRDYGNTYEDLWTIDYTGSYPWEEPAIYERLSPSSAVERIQTPVLLMHGDEDKNVFINNSQEMWHGLYHLGRTVEFVRYPRDAHGFWEPNHQIDEMDRVLRWFGRYLQSPLTADPTVWQGHRLSVGSVKRSGPHLLLPVAITAVSPLTVVLCGTGKAEVWLEVGHQELEPVGVVAEGGALLYGEVRSTFDGTTIVTLAFDAPPEATDLTLRCLGFAPIKLPAI